MFRVTLLVAAVLLLAACAGGRAGSPPLGITGSWELVDGVTAPQPTVATMVVDGTTLSGRSFCNSYTGTYRLDGDRLTVEGLGGTEMGCDPEVMAAEARFLDVLGAGGTVTRDGEALLVTGADVALRFRPVPPVPTSALVGTEWVLESLLDGDTASSTVGQPATLRLADDGTMHGSTGCRILTGTWATHGGSVVLPDLAAEGECPDDVRAQDEHVLAVLGDGFRPEVDEDRLTALDTDGRGLVYRAG